MALRSFAHVPYMPMLSLRPAEMLALEELPNSTKDRMLPIVHLRPWTTAYALESSLDRLRKAYGTRPIVVSIAQYEEVAKRRPVHDELDLLRSPIGGYENWFRFLDSAENSHFIPAVQLEDPRELSLQIASLSSLQRGLVVIVPRAAFGGLKRVAQRVQDEALFSSEACFVLDEGRLRSDALERAASLVGSCNIIREACPKAAIAISGSSFPEQFEGVTRQPIYERLLFDQVAAKVGRGGLIYSDRGSTRAERLLGGGVPRPRIDYPEAGQWHFFRSASESTWGYPQMARALIKRDPPIFDKRLRIWGTLMIERTAQGEEPSIASTVRSTAVRINLHLQQQTFFNDPIGLLDNEDDW